MPRSAHPAAVRQPDHWTGTELFQLPPRERARQIASSDAGNGRGRPMRPQFGPMSRLTARALAIAQRQVRVALLVEEEGLERGAITRIAGWLGVSPSTVGRDIQALLAAGDPVIVSARARASRRRSNGSIGHAV